MNLKGKNALITGSKQGIGKAIAKVFSDKTSCIILNATSQDNLESTSEQLRLSGCKAKMSSVEVFAGTTVTSHP